MDERHYNFYERENLPLPSQELLLQSSEEKGFEQGPYGILTVANFGVPTTVILLLMRSHKSELERIQNLIFENTTQPEPIESNTLERYEIFEPDFFQTYPNLERHKGFSVDNYLHVSGSTVSCTTYKYIPADFDSHFPINTFAKNQVNQSVHIERDWFEMKIEEAGINIPIIDIYKNYLAFLEFSYALKERIEKVEIKNFNDLLHKVLRVPLLGDVFNGNVGRRGGVMHENNLNFKINYRNELVVGNVKILDSINIGFRQSLEWVEEIYSQMLSLLNE